ncbi:hepatocellular carcinoma-associated antigen 59 [Diplodia corticola]|uniref:Hepatocellular carcinoma-associated antigen 59 n=1 Tax=Diplodia corticola TaxID=236234 RepID=A0A1J9R8Y9_9PEZI|nr:hepatocellular carcinoma-associated antigen 59 [Diplodia corticola]OJD36977.1 hepatocellular carcinoma-associated antigen 59 [Diplodia corticola]
MAEASFRARKRQKVYRKRLDEDDDGNINDAQAQAPNASGNRIALTTTTPATVSASAPSTFDASDPSTLLPTAADAQTNIEAGGQPSVAEILRRARKQKTRGVGVEFSSSGGGKSHGSSEVAATAVAPPVSGAPPEQQQVEVLAAKEFAPQTGMVAESLDKHMMAYIDSKMAEMREGERRAAAEQAATDAMNHHHQQQQSSEMSATPSFPSNGVRQRQPAGMGKLMEIDLGPEAARRNIERTEEATRRLESGESLELEMQPKGRRGRKRRTSEDIRRDKLVEEILKESRLEMYDDRAQLEQQKKDAEEGAADDRIVEQFRRDFMEAVQTRHNRRPPASASAKNKAADERPKGPKLGGSRAARAAMRAAEQQKKK